MSKTYNILWIDDEHNDEALFPFILQAEQQDIVLEGYGSFKEGFNALEANINFYDVILLDALFFEDENSQTPNPAGLGSAIQKINELRNKKSFPYFVLSGQTHFTEVTNPILEAFKLRCYNKKNPEDVIELLQNIKAEADMQTDLQIKHENQLLFEILNKYPDTIRDTFIAIFKGLKGFNNHFDDQLYFTQIRIILETMFRMANTYGLLHDKCVQVGGDKVNLNESCLFLSGYDTNHLKVSCSVTHFPKIIANNVKNIIHTTGAASHTTTVDVTQNIHIQAYRKSINTPYLLYSLALQLMDILIWFDGYSKSNSDIALNKSYWKDLEYDKDGNKIETAKIVKVAANGWASVLVEDGTKSISVYKGDVNNLNLNTGDTIKFTIKDSSQAQNIIKL
ncbi:hypothetical protein [Olleya aquimaris]|uniref:Uncharacterized protein n=1 Tax=Olleya aquimaris TaxID=639310 RepID=A0A327RQH7_9FLAO|nr:hypothetical protein [Olleya aquimaris]RAJ17833.1 hypothetical protein LY08_00101 [Olleya aquimaris]